MSNFVKITEGLFNLTFPSQSYESKNGGLFWMYNNKGFQTHKFC